MTAMTFDPQNADSFETSFDTKPEDYQAFLAAYRNQLFIRVSNNLRRLTKNSVFSRLGHYVLIRLGELDSILALLRTRVTNRLNGLKKQKGGAIDAITAKLKAFVFETSHKKQASDTQPTITLSTLRTSAAIFRRVGICA
jgi:hypothetical protein